MAELSDSDRNRAHAIEIGSTIVEATGIIVGFNGDRSDAKAAIEEAMMAAVHACQAEGVTDLDEIRARMFAARDAAREG